MNPSISASVLAGDRAKGRRYSCEAANRCRRGAYKGLGDIGTQTITRRHLEPL